MNGSQEYDLLIVQLVQEIAKWRREVSESVSSGKDFPRLKDVIAGLMLKLEISIIKACYPRTEHKAAEDER